MQFFAAGVSRVLICGVVVTTALTVAACGGGGNDGGGSGTEGPERYAQSCAPTNPFRGDALAPTRGGSLLTEKQWLRAYMDEAYLWYGEIPRVDPDLPAYSSSADVFGSLENYFYDLLTPVIRPSGLRKDRYSFAAPTAAFNALVDSGISAGYGMELLFDPVPPRNVRVAFVHPDSPAGAAGVVRGMHLTYVDWVWTDSDAQRDIDALNAALFGAPEGAVHHFEFVDAAGQTLSVDLAMSRIVLQPVPEVQVLEHQASGIGYLLFNDHIATAEGALIDAVAALRDAGIEALVLDLRYNGGGLAYIASQLAYMIAGPQATTGKVFESLRFNDRLSAELGPWEDPFVDCTSDRDFDCSGSPNLPVLALDQLFVIASGSTCSASEAIVNGLRGIDIDVRLVGSTTCGKPYGMFQQDNCGISYLPVTFQGVNAKGFGDYADGLAPDCAAADDLGHALGDPAEASFAAALALAAGGDCPSMSKALRAGGSLRRPPARENRLLRTAPERMRADR